MDALKSLYLLDPDVTFLNHGSFGATPKPVFDAYQAWQRRLEFQPVKFLGREIGHYLQQARVELGTYLHTDKDNLVFIPNTTYGVNLIARSLVLGSGDDVLTTNQEYGACDKTWRFMSQKKGFRYVKQSIAYPFASKEEMIEQFWTGVTPQTRVIFISHITSTTAVTFPVKEICHRAREAGILTVIDGAHAPGQINLNLNEIDPDFYCGNLHKWLSAPKGSAFIYTRPDKQDLIEPLIVSWGWGEPKEFSYGSEYLDNLQWVGTKDISAYLAVPAAIAFQKEHHWTAVRQECHALLNQGLAHISEVTQLPSPYPNDTFYHQMGIFQLPKVNDLFALKDALYDQFKVEIPAIQWGEHQFLRISVQGYNSAKDIEILLDALQSLLPQFKA